MPDDSLQIPDIRPLPRLQEVTLTDKLSQALANLMAAAATGDIVVLRTGWPTLVRSRQTQAWVERSALDASELTAMKEALFSDVNLNIGTSHAVRVGPILATGRQTQDHFELILVQAASSDWANLVQGMA